MQQYMISLHWGLRLIPCNKRVQTVHIDLFKQDEFPHNVNLIPLIDHYYAIISNACMANLIATS